MNILYIGNFVPPHSTESHVARSLEALGYSVTRLQENETSFDAIEHVSLGNAFILFTSTHEYDIKGDRGQWLKRKSLPLVGFHLDIWFGLERERLIRDRAFFDCDYMFTADGGHQDRFKAYGKKHFWSPPAVLKDECYIADVPITHDIVFTGSYHYHREYPERPRLIDFLKETYGPRFAYYGHGDGMRGDKLNRLYASSKIVIGDSLDSPYYWSDRMPETLGRGGFLLHPNVKGMDKFYTPLVHYMSYKRYDHADLKRTIDACLESPEICETIRRHGHEHVKANHTYKNRMTSMLEVLHREGVC